MVIRSVRLNRRMDEHMNGWTGVAEGQPENITFLPTLLGGESIKILLCCTFFNGKVDNH